MYKRQILFSQTAASEQTVEPLLDEELFAILPAESDLVPRGQSTITLAQLAELPLILPSPGHGLRRRIALEFERMNIALDAVAEIDSLPLLMACVDQGVGSRLSRWLLFMPSGTTLSAGDVCGYRTRPCVVPTTSTSCVRPSGHRSGVLWARRAGTWGEV